MCVNSVRVLHSYAEANGSSDSDRDGTQSRGWLGRTIYDRYFDLICSFVVVLARVCFSIVQSVVLGCASAIVTIRWRIHIADEIEDSCGT